MAQEGEAGRVAQERDPGHGQEDDRGSEEVADPYAGVPSPADAEVGTPSEPVEQVEWENHLWPVVRVHPSLSEEAYVAAEVLASRLLVQQGLKNPDGKREERVRHYASWRYRGWQAGEIASL
jgi:hypothetical protein